MSVSVPFRRTKSFARVGGVEAQGEVGRERDPLSPAPTPLDHLQAEKDGRTFWKMWGTSNPQEFSGVTYGCGAHWLG